MSTLEKIRACKTTDELDDLSIEVYDAKTVASIIAYQNKYSELSAEEECARLAELD